MYELLVGIRIEEIEKIKRMKLKKYEMKVRTKL